MPGTEHRGKHWGRDKDKAITKIGYQIDEWIEELVSLAIQSYIDSEDFEREACDYCSGMGWRLPE